MTSATAQARPEPENGFSKARLAFRNWRRSRPFWGGLLVLIAGGPILYFPYANLTLGSLSLHLSTTAGAQSLVIGVLLIALGISVWFQPHVRVFAGIAALVLTLISIPMSNLAGFGLALLPGLIGGALVCSWAPLKQPAPAAEGAEGAEGADSAAFAQQPQVEGGQQPEQTYPIAALFEPAPGAAPQPAAEAPTMAKPVAQPTAQPAAPGAVPAPRAEETSAQSEGAREGAHDGE